MKSLLFIIPWSGYYINHPDTSFADEPERAPEGVVGLATYLATMGAPVAIADMQRILRRYDGDCQKAMNELWKICMSFTPEIIGFSFFTARFEYAAQIFSALSQRYDETNNRRPIMLAGGVHPTLLPEITFQYIPFDALIIGEGEKPLLRILQGEELKNIKGVSLTRQKEHPQADIIENLDELPIPDWSLIDKEFYSQPSYQISYGRLDKVMPVTFGRSCIYRCNFCAHNCFLKARHHSVDYFIEKMKSVSAQCNINTFVIQDSSIGNFKEAWGEVCQRLIEMGTPYHWWANLRVNQVDESFLQLLKDAGCIKLFFGFESGSQRILDKMNKRTTVSQCREAAQLCHKIGIPFYTSYIINYFNEEESDLILTEELIRETNPTSLAINRFSPIPGSKDYDANEDVIAPLIQNIHDWTTLGMLSSPVLFGNMPKERFEYWYNRLRLTKKTINNHEDTDKQP